MALAPIGVAVMLLAAMLLAALTAPVSAAPASFVTADGQRVATPAIQGLDCAAMAAVLDAIDRTQYRGAGPRPKNKADAPLFAYERRLSERHYQSCARAKRKTPPGERSFRSGFRLTPASQPQ